jgi:hypothetical protein
MRLVPRVVAIATVSIAAALPGAAQETPTGVATAFFEAMAEERWRDAARSMDLLAFDRYRREQISAVRLPQPPRRRMTVDDYLQHQPDMPRAVAEYHVRTMNERVHDPSEWLLREFAGVRSLDSLAALSAEEAAARWLQAQDFRWSFRQAREQERARGCPIPDEADQHLPAPEHRVVGAVIVDSATAYVLHEDDQFRRAEPDRDAAMHAPLPNILTLRRRGDRWRILPRQAMFHGSGAVAHVSVQCVPSARPRPPR